MKRRLALLATFVLVTAASGVAPAVAEPVKIRISWAAVPAHLTPLLPLAPKDVYRHHGKSYTVEPTHVAGSGPALQALAAGELQIAGASPQTLVLGIERAKIDLKVIAQLMSQGVKGYPQTSFYGRKGEFKSVDELKGKTIAINARGSTMDAAVRAIMGQRGWQDGRDYQLVEVRFGAMIAALESKRVDVAPLLQPFNLMADAKGELTPIFSTADALGATQTLQYFARADWIAKNRAALVDFFEDHLRYRRWLMNPANREEAIKIVSSAAKQPVEAFKDWVFTNDGYYYDPDGLSDTALLQKNIDDLQKLGVLPVRIDVAKHTDMSLVQEAAKRLQ
jgi:NitT/TauT family transport system substrate-binding protein